MTKSEEEKEKEGKRERERVPQTLFSEDDLLSRTSSSNVFISILMRRRHFNRSISTSVADIINKE